MTSLSAGRRAVEARGREVVAEAQKADTITRDVLADAGMATDRYGLTSVIS